MKTLFVCFLASSLFYSPIVFAASPETSDLEKQLQQKDDQIERLEQEVEYLRNQLMDLQYNASESNDSSQAMDGKTLDPLVGNWECTNKVFSYGISFLEDGRIVQEEPFFSKVKTGNWSRLDENRIFFEEGGATFNTEFLSNDELIVTNLANRAIWECFRK